MKLKIVVVLLICFGLSVSGSVMAQTKIARAQEDIVLDPGDLGNKTISVKSAPGTAGEKSGRGASHMLRVDVGMFQYNIECGGSSDWTNVVISRFGAEKLQIKKSAKGRLLFYDGSVRIGHYCDYDVAGACDAQGKANAGLPAEFWGAYTSILVFNADDPKKFCFAGDEEPLEIELVFYSK